MDSFGVRNVMSDQKTNAVRLINYPSFRRLNVTFRVMEVCVFLIIVSRFTAHLLDTIKLSGDYIWGVLSISSVRPLLVFLMVNTVVVILFLKSRQAKDGTDHPSVYFNPITDSHDDYVKTEKKQRVCIATGDQSLRRSSDYDDVACDIKGKKKISRSRSEIFNNKLKLSHHHDKGSCRELRRSLTVTERGRKQGNVDYSEEKWLAENEMSNEQFKRKIEAFIARQQRVLREEEDDFEPDRPFDHLNTQHI